MKYQSDREYNDWKFRIYNNRDEHLLNRQKHSFNEQRKFMENNDSRNKKQCIDPAVSSLKRDTLISNSQYYSKPQRKQYLFPEAQGSYKKDTESRKDPYKQSNQSHNLYRNNSSVNHYSYTEYQILRQQMEERGRAEQRWIEGQIRRMRTENQLLDSRHTSNTFKTKIERPSLPLKIQQNREVKEYIREAQQKQLNTLKNKQISHFLQSNSKYKHLDVNRSAGQIKTTPEAQSSKRIDQKMIENAFLFDDLKECDSDFELEDRNCESEEKSLQMERQRLYNSQLQTRHQKVKKSEVSSSCFDQNLPKQAMNLNGTKEDNIYADLLRKIQRSQIKANALRNNTYNNQLVFSNDCKQQTSSLHKSQTLLKNQNQDQQQILPRYTEQMEIHKITQKHFPIFSPYSQHKHLPHTNNNYLIQSTESKKSAKHYRALDEKRQNEFRGNQLTKSLIIDEAEKKKILTKYHYDHHLIHYHENQEQFTHERYEKRKTEGHLKGSHAYQLNQSSEGIANNLRIELEILKQQLDDKNRKVVDLQLELMQIKNGIIDRKPQIRSFSTRASIEQKIEQSKNDAQIFEDQQTQTYFHQKSLSVSHPMISETVLPQKKNNEDQLSQARSLIKKLQQKLVVQEQAMNNFLEDIQMYQKLNEQLKMKVKSCEEAKTSYKGEIKTSK